MKRPRQGAPGPKSLVRTVRALRVLRGGYRKKGEPTPEAYRWERPVACAGCKRASGTFIRLDKDVYSHKAPACIEKASGKVPA